MAEKKASAAAEEKIEILERAKGFWAKFSKPIIYVGGAIILITGGWLGYKSLVLLPNEEKSADMIFPAEQLFDKMTQQGFNKDSINIVLNGGNGVVAGVLKVADKFGGTAAGKRAHFIAGACYLHGGDFDKAIKQLKEFSSRSTQLQTAAYSMLGDAYAEQKKNDEAFENYKKAASVNSKDDFMTPEALYKAGMFAEATGKTKEAIEMYQKIKTDYPKNSHANDMDKYLARLGVVN